MSKKQFLHSHIAFRQEFLRQYFLVDGRTILKRLPELQRALFATQKEPTRIMSNVKLRLQTKAPKRYSCMRYYDSAFWGVLRKSETGGAQTEESEIEFAESHQLPSGESPGEYFR